MEKKLLVSLIVFMLICIAIWFQVNFLNIFTFFDTAANLAIVFICGIGLLSGKTSGALVGVTYGTLLDLLFGKSFGVYLLLYGLLGFASGEMSRGFSKENRMSMLYMVALFTIVTEIVTNLLFVFIYNYDLEIFIVKKIFLETAYNVILARILFKPLTSLSEIVNKCKNSYYLL